MLNLQIHPENDSHSTHHRQNPGHLPLLQPSLLEPPILGCSPSHPHLSRQSHPLPWPPALSLLTLRFTGRKRDPCTHCWRIMGMLTQLAAATAAKGTQRPSRAGALCGERGQGAWVSSLEDGGKRLQDDKTRNQTSLPPHTLTPSQGTQIPSKPGEKPTWDSPAELPTTWLGSDPNPTLPAWETTHTWEKKVFPRTLLPPCDHHVHSSPRLYLCQHVHAHSSGHCGGCGCDVGNSHLPSGGERCLGVGTPGG